LGSNLPISVTSRQAIDNKANCLADQEHVRRARGGICSAVAVTPSLMHKVIHKRLASEKELKKPQLRREINVLH
jgi:hypothetical protein